MDYSKKYAETIRAYKKMGKKYLAGIDPFIIKDVYRFMNKLPRGGRVLDVGCAGGRETVVLAKGGFEVIGIDLVDEFLERVKQRVPTAKFYKMNLLKLNFPKNHFDGIWASSVLLHIHKKDITQVFEGFSRVLKPGGKLFVSVKKGKGTTFAKDKLSTEKRLMILFSQKEIRDFATQAGFKLIDLKLVPDPVREEVQWIHLLAKKPKNK